MIDSHLVFNASTPGLHRSAVESALSAESYVVGRDASALCNTSREPALPSAPSLSSSEECITRDRSLCSSQVQAASASASHLNLESGPSVKLISHDRVALSTQGAESSLAHQSPGQLCTEAHRAGIAGNAIAESIYTPPAGPSDAAGPIVRVGGRQFEGSPSELLQVARVSAAPAVAVAPAELSAVDQAVGSARKKDCATDLPSASDTCASTGSHTDDVETYAAALAAFFLRQDCYDWANLVPEEVWVAASAAVQKGNVQLPFKAFTGSLRRYTVAAAKAAAAAGFSDTFSDAAAVREMERELAAHAELVHRERAAQTTVHSRYTLNARLHGSAARGNESRRRSRLSSSFPRDPTQRDLNRSSAPALSTAGPRRAAATQLQRQPSGTATAATSGGFTRQLPLEASSSHGAHTGPTGDASGSSWVVGSAVLIPATQTPALMMTSAGVSSSDPRSAGVASSDPRRRHANAPPQSSATAPVTYGAPRLSSLASHTQQREALGAPAQPPESDSAVVAVEASGEANSLQAEIARVELELAVARKTAALVRDRLRTAGTTDLKLGGRLQQSLEEKEQGVLSLEWRLDDLREAAASAAAPGSTVTATAPHSASTAATDAALAAASDPFQTGRLPVHHSSAQTPGASVPTTDISLVPGKRRRDAADTGAGRKHESAWASAWVEFTEPSTHLPAAVHEAAARATSTSMVLPVQNAPALPGASVAASIQVMTAPASTTLQALPPAPAVEMQSAAVFLPAAASAAAPMHPQWRWTPSTPLESLIMEHLVERGRSGTGVAKLRDFLIQRCFQPPANLNSILQDLAHSGAPIVFMPNSTPPFYAAEFAPPPPRQRQ